MDDATGPLGENWMRNMMYSVIIFKTMFKVMNHFFFTVTVYGFVIVRSICILAPRATGRRGGKKETPWTGSRYSRFLTRWCALVLILGPLCMNRDLWRGPNIRIVEKFRISRKTCVPLFGIQWNQMVRSLLESNHALNVCHTSQQTRVKNGYGFQCSSSSIRFSFQGQLLIAWGVAFMIRWKLEKKKGCIAISRLKLRDSPWSDAEPDARVDTYKSKQQKKGQALRENDILLYLPSGWLWVRCSWDIILSTSCRHASWCGYISVFLKVWVFI